KRVLCLRFLNWPVQRRQHHQILRDRSAQNPVSDVSRHRMVVYSASPSAADTADSAAGRSDRKFLRELFPMSRHSATVICVSDEARQDGVRPGISLAEARSFSEYAGKGPRNPYVFAEWSPEPDRDRLIETAERVRRFAPIVSADEMPIPDSLLLDVTGCGPLFGGESGLAEELLRHLQNVGFRCRISISDSVAAAWAFAHPRGHFLAESQRPAHRRNPRSGRSMADAEWDLPIVIIPHGQADKWLNDLPIAAGRIPPADQHLLRQLGITTLQKFLQLPSDDLPSRFSSETLLRRRQLLQEDPEHLIGLPEPVPVEAGWSGEYPARDSDEIQRVAEFLIHQISDQLQNRRLAASGLQCILLPETGTTHTPSSSRSGTSTNGSRDETDSSSSPEDSVTAAANRLQISCDLLRPTQSAEQLLQVLSLKLERIRIPGPVRSVTLTAVTATLPVARQRHLFSDDEHTEHVEELAAVVSRLAGRLGKDGVLRADIRETAVPEKSVGWIPLMDRSRDDHSTGTERILETLVTPSDESPSTGLSPTRPLRLLPEPVMIANTAIADVPPRFQWKGADWTPIQWAGPDRIETHWWDDPIVRRDYFRVQCEQGSVFWIYRDLVNRHWYLHGIFE
ncbi:MAG: DNA polymerase Y family protein, partial [Planctomycetaceae bacterium]|nr:DNA polymerase Y family protein [Planctomycetaceae bacterium]